MVRTKPRVGRSGLLLFDVAGAIPYLALCSVNGFLPRRGEGHRRLISNFEVQQVAYVEKLKSSTSVVGVCKTAAEPEVSA